MADQAIENYPDVLGFVTSDRHNVGPVQVALTTNPTVAQGGKPFEVILLIQNTLDIAVDVIVNLQPPDKDDNGKKDRFLVDQTRLVVGVKGAEVGYIRLPISTLPDVAPSKEYYVGMDVSAKPTSKVGNTIRAVEGGGEFRLSSLSKAQQQEILTLTKLKFSAKKRGGILRGGNTIEARFAMKPGRVGSPLNLEPGWVTLWTLENQTDVSVLFGKYRELFRVRVIPKLERENVFPPLLEKTIERYEKAGYPLQPMEASAIARLMTLILEYANASHTTQDIVTAGIYNFEQRTADDYEERDDSPPLPRWVNGLLKGIHKDQRIAKVPHKAIPLIAYDDLLYDAVVHGFHLIEKATGEDLGTEEEINAYADSVVKKLSEKAEMNFSYTYIPLVIGGVIAYDHVMMGDENLAEVLSELKTLLDQREHEQTDENGAIFDLSYQVLTLYLRKYGSLDSRDK